MGTTAGMRAGQENLYFGLTNGWSLRVDKAQELKTAVIAGPTVL